MNQRLFNQANNNAFIKCFDAEALIVMNSTIEDYKKRPIYGRVIKLADRLFGSLDSYDNFEPATILLPRAAFIGGAAVARQLVMYSKLPSYKKVRVLGLTANEPIDTLLHPSFTITSLYDAVKAASDEIQREVPGIHEVAKKVGLFYGETAEGPSRVGVRELEFTAATMGVGYLAHIYSMAHQKAIS